MTQLRVEQRSIKDLLQDKDTNFLIPDYQRHYEWGEKECQTLWEDLFDFAFPNNNKDDFNVGDLYYLGAIVVFSKENKRRGQKEKINEVIDGQQRITSIMLLLRVFCKSLENMQDSEAISTKQNIEQCIWKTNEFGKPDKSKLKIDSKVIDDEDKEEFLNILKTGNINKDKAQNQYAENYSYFEKKVEEFKQNFSSYFSYLPIRILNNCIFLPIEAGDFDTAIRIFSTLNDRGLPLYDSDIFKAQFYKYFDNKDEFIKKWRELEKNCKESRVELNDIFSYYMYYKRAKKGIRSSTLQGLRAFYETYKDGDSNTNYSLLQNKMTLDNLIILSNFWKEINSCLTGGIEEEENTLDFQEESSQSLYSIDTIKALFVLHYAPNDMWKNIVSVYFMQHKDKKGRVEDKEFYTFLQKVTLFVLGYNLVNPGYTMSKTPMFNEMINIVEGREVNFKGYEFDEKQLKQLFDNYEFTNTKGFTKSILVWYAFTFKEQSLLSIDTKFDIEHIYSKKRYEVEKSLKSEKMLESIGNKSILERRINIGAADYSFSNKKKYYLGEVGSGKRRREGTAIYDVQNSICKENDWEDKEINERYGRIYSKFISELKENGLLKDNRS